MARMARMFARRMVEAERERLKDKERAARRLAEAVEGLRVAALELREATEGYTALEPAGRARLSELLGLTSTEARIAYDAKRTLVRLPGTDDGNTHETDVDEGMARPAQPAAGSPTPAMGGGGADGAPTTW